MKSIAAIITVALNPINAFDPINLRRDDSSAPDKYLIKPVFVIPNLNISTNEPAAMNKTHWPNISTERLLASSANPEMPNSAIARFPAKERKFSSLTILWNFFFNAFLYLIF